MIASFDNFGGKRVEIYTGKNPMKPHVNYYAVAVFYPDNSQYIAKEGIIFGKVDLEVENDKIINRPNGYVVFS